VLRLIHDPVSHHHRHVFPQVVLRVWDRFVVVVLRLHTDFTDFQTDLHSFHCLAVKSFHVWKAKKVCSRWMTHLESVRLIFLVLQAAGGLEHPKETFVDGAYSAAKIISKYSSLGPIVPPGGSAASQSQAFSLPFLSQPSQTEALNMATSLGKQQQSLEGALTMIQFGILSLFSDPLRTVLDRTAQMLSNTLRHIDQGVTRVLCDTATLITQQANSATFPSLVQQQENHLLSEMRSGFAELLALHRVPVRHSRDANTQTDAQPMPIAQQEPTVSHDSADAWLYEDVSSPHVPTPALRLVICAI
jgi:hypothetical protein